MGKTSDFYRFFLTRGIDWKLILPAEGVKLFIVPGTHNGINIAGTYGSCKPVLKLADRCFIVLDLYRFRRLVF